MANLARELYLDVTKINQPAAKTSKLRQPRIGLYQPWMSDMDEGWTRLVLENHEFSLTTLHNADVRAGLLNDRFDVVILPSQSPDSIINGHPKGTMPPEYVGGISEAGVLNLKKFVENGGTLATLGSACDLPLEQFQLPLKNVIKPLKPEDFFASGLLLNATFDQEKTIAYGMPKEAPVFFAESPTFQILPASEEKDAPLAVAKYPDKDIVLSGWMLGESYLQNKAAAVEAPLGKGKIILLGFRVQHRGQTKATFKLLFNSIFSSALEY